MLKLREVGGKLHMNLTLSFQVFGESKNYIRIESLLKSSFHWTWILLPPHPHSKRSSGLPLNKGFQGFWYANWKHFCLTTIVGGRVYSLTSS